MNESLEQMEFHSKEGQESLRNTVNDFLTPSTTTLEKIKEEWRADNPFYKENKSYEREQKIRQLKTTIKITQEEIQEMLANLDIKKELELPEEEQKKNKEEFSKNMAVKKALIQASKEILNTTRLNKHSSPHFEFTPHKGMNRSKAKEFRKQRVRKNG